MAQRETTAGRAIELPREERGGMLRSLRHREYRLFWIGLGLALTGFQVGRVALAYLAYQLTGSAFYLTLVFGGDALPMMFLSPLGGVLVDRVNRKALLLVCRSLIAVLAVAVSALVIAGLAEAWHLLAFTLATGVLYAFDIPTRQALIRDLVPEEDFFNAVALSSTVMQATRIIGPAIGGVALVVAGTGGTLALMAAGNLGLVLMVAMMRFPRRPAPVTRTSTWTNLVDGFRFIKRQEAIWVLMVIAAIPSAFAMTYQSLTPVFAQDILGQDKSAIGVMLAAAGVGALAGSGAVAAYGERLGRPRVSALAAVGFSALVIVFAVSRSYVLSLGLLVLVGAVGAIYSVINSTVVQARTPREMQGRVMGVYQMTWNVNLPGSVLIGALADSTNAPFALAVAGGVTVLAVSLLLAWRPSLRAA